jgi:hypothetical protein
MKRFICALTLAVALIPIAPAQDTPSLRTVNGFPDLKVLEGIDHPSGIHYARLYLSLPHVADSTAVPPRFTLECTETRGHRDQSWYVSFGGVEQSGFTAPFRPKSPQDFPPTYPSVNLKMTFEGYMKWKPYVESWEALPSGELHYRNPSLQSPNMDSPRHFLQYLNSLPGLRIGYAKRSPTNPQELQFQLRPLLDEMRKISICESE